MWRATTSGGATPALSRALPLWALTLLLLAACEPGKRAVAGVDGACAGDADCATGLSCVTGRCAVPAGLRACTPGARSCDGADVLLCDAQGVSTSVVLTCPGACSDGACVVDACTAGARRCGTAGVETCERSGAGALGWVLAQACPAGCDAASTTCRALACRPLEVRCSPAAPGTVQLCAPDGSGFVDQPCPTGDLCEQGACVAPACVPGAATCDGGDRVVCAADGSGPASRTRCPSGCANGACLTALCSAGATRCSAATPGVVEVCLNDGSGWVAQQVCGTGAAAAASCIALPGGGAACTAQLCSPLARRCDATGGAVQICAGDGLSWTPGPPCSDGCANGACLPPPAGCTAGALRCAGAAVQRCDAQSGGGTAWDTVAQCLGGCSGGACSGGSCTAAFTVAVPVATCAGCAPPADGTSTLLAVTSQLTDLSGNSLPDGTLVTVSATVGSPPQQLVSAADADPATPGVQVRTFRGVADFAFRAPPASALDASSTALVTVAATVGNASACAAAAQVQFGPAQGYAYAAEDFTSDRLRDVPATTVDWRTDEGAVIARTGPFGTGADGDLLLAANTRFDLINTVRSGRAAPDGAVARVVTLVSNAAGQGVVQLDVPAAPFAPGDEVLLLELQGASPASVLAAGTWETLTVAQSSGNQLTFTAPLTGTYGAAPGAALAGEHVVVQRIPQYGNVTLQAGATLTAAAWDGTRGGVVAFRAAGRVTVASGAAISADGLGYRGGGAVTPVDAAHAQAGESAGGFAPVAAAPQSNLGAGGGGLNLCETAHLDQTDSWFGAGASYGDTRFGDAGSSKAAPSPLPGPRGACLAAQGTPYGTPTLRRLFPGSGSGTQEFNAHGPCSGGARGTCPGESQGSIAAAVEDLARDDCPAGSACADAFNICKTEQRTLKSAIRSSDNPGACTADCADTFATCKGTYSTTYAPAIKPDDGNCANQSCTNTLSVCGTFSHDHPTQPAPCAAGTNACTDTFSSCGSYTFSVADDSSTCYSRCPGDVTSYTNSCGQCGFDFAHPYDCYVSDGSGDPVCSSATGCNGVAYRTYGDPSSTGLFGACGSCSHSEDSCTNCSCFLGVCDYCTCNRPVYHCYPCANCTHCRGCVANNGCTTNGGCATSPGCYQSLGCSICGTGAARCDLATPGSCTICPLPAQRAVPGGAGGGILFVAAAQLDVSAGGRVSANGLNPAADAQYGQPFAGGSGGSLWLRVAALTLGSGTVAAVGGAHGGDGRIRIDRGGGDPVTSPNINPAPGYAPPFGLPAAQSLSIAPAGKLVDAATLLFALDTNGAGPAVTYAISGTGAAGPFLPASTGAAVTLTHSADVRWQAQLSAPPGARGSTSALLFLLQLH